METRYAARVLWMLNPNKSPPDKLHITSQYRTEKAICKKDCPLGRKIPTSVGQANSTEDRRPIQLDAIRSPPANKAESN